MEYFIELNAKFIKSYKSKQRAIEFAKSKASDTNLVRVWSKDQEEVWSNVMED